MAPPFPPPSPPAAALGVFVPLSLPLVFLAEEGLSRGEREREREREREANHINNLLQIILLSLSTN